MRFLFDLVFVIHVVIGHHQFVIEESVEAEKGEGKIDLASLSKGAIVTLPSGTPQTLQDSQQTSFQ